MILGRTDLLCILDIHPQNTDKLSLQNFLHLQKHIKSDDEAGDSGAFGDDEAWGS